MHIAREVGSLLMNVDDVIEARRAVAATVRPLRASHARVVVAVALAELDEKSRAIALPIVERLPLRCRPSAMALLLSGPAAGSETASVLSPATHSKKDFRRSPTMVRDNELITLKDALREIGISRVRLHRLLKRRGLRPVYVGQIGYIAGSIVNELARAHRAWRRTEQCRNWQTKTGHQWSGT